MSDRDSSRHRSSRRASTPLSDLTGAVTGQIAAITGQFSSVGRGGAVVAVSTGLVATGGITASAAHAAVEASPQNAAIDAAAFVSTSSAFAAPLLGTQPAMSASSASLTAPATSKVTFETGAFTAVPKPVAAPAPAPAVAREATAPAATRTVTVKKASTTKKSQAAPASSAKGGSVLSIAARYVGIMYRYGGTTPAGFDCSGYTRYVYKQLGVSLPRTANQQMNATTRISRSAAKPGDLVFFTSGGRAYHMGIYAGGNQMYDSPRSGKSIAKRKIWSSAVVFGRV